METHDSLGRVYPNHLEASEKNLIINRAREQMLQRLNWFVALPNWHLRAYLKNFGQINYEKQSDALTALSSSKPDSFLYRNPLQNPRNAGGYMPRNHSIVSELGVKGIAHLKKKKLWQNISRTSGFWHELACSIFLAEMELATMDTQTITFKPRHMVTKVENGYPVKLGDKDTMLFDDGLFILNYGNEDRFHFLEIDLGNEQQSAKNGKKSIERMLRQWYAFLKRPKTGQRSPYGKHFDVNNRAVVHFVFNNEQRMKNAIEILMKITNNKGSSEILFSYDTRFERGGFLAPKVSDECFTREYLRAGKAPVYINK